MPTKKNIMKVTEGRRKSQKMRSQGVVNLGEHDRIKHKKGEILRCRADRGKFNNAWICEDMALEHMHGL